MSENKYQQDIDRILAHRFDLGWDYWTTEDLRLGKGGAFSAIGCANLLIELGVPRTDPMLVKVAELIFSLQRPDGRFRLAPKGAIYPCHTIQALQVLCRLGLAQDERLDKTWQQLLASRHTDGGWRCLKFSYGHGPETEASNPGPTLIALDAFRARPDLIAAGELDPAVEFLLDHWTTRLPLGPCHYGIGSLFLQTEYPFMVYNLFYYVYVLSHYPRAQRDPRFLQALQTLEEGLADGAIVVARTNPKLKDFDFCRKGQPSELATQRYHEILANLADR